MHGRAEQTSVPHNLPLGNSVSNLVNEESAEKCSNNTRKVSSLVLQHHQRNDAQIFISSTISCVIFIAFEIMVLALFNEENEKAESSSGLCAVHSSMLLRRLAPVKQRGATRARGRERRIRSVLCGEGGGGRASEARSGVS